MSVAPRTSAAAKTRHGPAYPVLLSLEGRAVLIVGGGAVALRKARALLAGGAKVTVLGESFSRDFKKLPAVRLLRRNYRAGWLNRPGAPRWRLVFAATNQPAVNAQVRRDAQRAGIWCCRCDAPEASDFVRPAVQTRGAIMVAVSTRGAAPALARRLCRGLANRVDGVWRQHVRLLTRWRTEVLAEMPAGKQRRAFLERLAGAEMEQVLRQGGEQAALRLFARWRREQRALGGVRF